MAHKPTDLRPLMARIPESLRLCLEREAKRNDRSLNAEITERLERSFDPLTLDLFPQIVAEIENAVRRAAQPGMPINVYLEAMKASRRPRPDKPDQPFVGEGIVQLARPVENRA